MKKTRQQQQIGGGNVDDQWVNVRSKDLEHVTRDHLNVTTSLLENTKQIIFNYEKLVELQRETIERLTRDYDEQTESLARFGDEITLYKSQLAQHDSACDRRVMDLVEAISRDLYTRSKYPTPDEAREITRKLVLEMSKTNSVAPPAPPYPVHLLPEVIREYVKTSTTPQPQQQIIASSPRVLQQSAPKTTMAMTSSSPGRIGPVVGSRIDEQIAKTKRENKNIRKAMELSLHDQLMLEIAKRQQLPNMGLKTNPSDETGEEREPPLVALITSPRKIAQDREKTLLPKDGDVATVIETPSRDLAMKIVKSISK